MVDKGEGDNRYQELKDGIYHGYQPLRARKTTTYSYTPDFIPGCLNMYEQKLVFPKNPCASFSNFSAVARDIDSIPSGPKDGSDYQMITAHKVNRAPMVSEWNWEMAKMAKTFWQIEYFPNT
jgi:hypothetical protein